MSSGVVISLPPRNNMRLERRMGKAFASAYQRIIWAEEHILELTNESMSFFSSTEYKRVVEARPSETVDKLRLNGRLPHVLTRHTVQAIENLRSALDHATCAVVAARQRKKTAFPFGRRKKDFEKAIHEKCRHVPIEIRSVYRSFHPYRRGNPPLWALNELCNTNKHRTLIQPGIIVKDVVLAGTSLGWFGWLLYRPTWDKRKNEIIISRRSGERTVHHDVEFSLGVAFGKVPIFGGHPVLASLRFLTSRVRQVVMATEAEARRIGVVR